MEEVTAKTSEKVEDTLYEFKCFSCEINEKVQYKGTNPPFSRNIVLKYPSYAMKDPFSLPGKGEVLVLGGDCVECKKPVCISKECSLFYHKMYCLDCVKKSIDSFPIEIKNKLMLTKKL